MHWRQINDCSVLRITIHLSSKASQPIYLSTHKNASVSGIIEWSISSNFFRAISPFFLNRSSSPLKLRRTWTSTASKRKNKNKKIYLEKRRTSFVTPIRDPTWKPWRVTMNMKSPVQLQWRRWWNNKDAYVFNWTFSKWRRDVITSA